MKFFNWVKQTILGKLVLTAIIILFSGLSVRFFGTDFDNKEWYQIWPLYPFYAGWVIFIGFFLVQMGYVIYNMFRKD